MLQMEIEDLDECVSEATRALFEQMLGTEPREAPPPTETPAGFGAVVTIGAPTPLRLHIVLPSKVVEEVAQYVFGIPREEVGDPECRDLLGEMANIVGGSLKGMFDDATSLSLPTTFATSSKYRAPEGARQLWFAVGGETFGVWCEVMGG